MEALIKKANLLIESYHNHSFTLYETRILLKVCSMINIKDKRFRDYIFNISDFAKEFDFNIDYADFKKAVKGLVGKTIQIKVGRRGWEVFSYLSYGKYIPYEGKVHLRFDPAMTPYLLELDKCFTSYKLKYVANLRRANSLRLYELLKQYEGAIGSRTISVINIIRHLNLQSKAYKIYGSFKQIILTPCINEINEKTDIQVSFDEIKEGRKVVEIKFNIDRNDRVIDIKKENKKPKEPDGQIVIIKESGETIIERVFIEEFLNNLAIAQSESSTNIDGGRQKQKNFIKEAVSKVGLKRIYKGYCDEMDARGDFIDFYYKGMWFK